MSFQHTLEALGACIAVCIVFLCLLVILWSSICCLLSKAYISTLFLCATQACIILCRWTREWTAEENRHGDLMNKYCMLSGRVNMKAVEVTIQNLIGSGMDPKTENNPYLGFIYTSFQERATKISHGNTARHAKDYGDKVLGQITGAIAADEGRHESAYSRIVDELFRK